MATGFSNERSSEYMICNNLYNKLEKECSFFYPFYYQSKRDDTEISLLNSIENLHLIACFARRPKVNRYMSNNTYITFRKSMFEQTNILNNYNIQVVSGTPIGASIDNIGFGSSCKWFLVQSDISEDYVTYEFYKENILDHSMIDGIKLINDNELRNILKTTQCYSWKEIMNLLKNWQKDFKECFRMSTGLFHTIPVQRPIFIAYKY